MFHVLIGYTVLSHSVLSVQPHCWSNRMLELKGDGVEGGMCNISSRSST